MILKGFNSYLPNDIERIPIERVWNMRFKDWYGTSKVPKLNGIVVKELTTLKESKDPKMQIYQILIDSKFIDIFRVFLDQDDVHKNVSTKLTWISTKRYIERMQIEKSKTKNEQLRLLIVKNLLDLENGFKDSAINSIGSSFNNYIDDITKEYQGNTITKYQAIIDLANQIKNATIELKKERYLKSIQANKCPVIIHHYFKCMAENYQLFYPNIETSMLYMDLYVQGILLAVEKLVENADKNMHLVTEDDSNFIIETLMDELDVIDNNTIPNTRSIATRDVDMAETNLIQYSVSVDSQMVNSESTPKLLKDVCPSENKYVYMNGEMMHDLQVPIENNAKIIAVQPHTPTIRCKLNIMETEMIMHLPQDIKVDNILTTTQIDQIKKGELKLKINGQEIENITDIPPAQIQSMSVNHFNYYFTFRFKYKILFCKKLFNNLEKYILWYLFAFKLLALGNLFPLFYNINILDLNVAFWNCDGSFNTHEKQQYCRAFMIEQNIDILFIGETQFDGDKHNRLPLGVKAASTVEYDSNNSPHYGMALMVLDTSLAKRISRFHTSPTQISIMIDGYVFNGFYKKHRTDVDSFCSELFQIDSINQISLGDLNMSAFSPRNRNELNQTRTIQDLNYEFLEKDGQITRHARIATHRSSDIDHFILANHLLAFAETGHVYDVPEYLSDHSIIHATLHLPITQTTINTSKFRVKLLNENTKKEEYQSKLEKILINKNVINLTNNISSFRDLSHLIKIIQQSIRTALNESVGKSSPKSIKDLQMPHLLQNIDLHTINYPDYISRIKKDKINGIKKYQEYLKTLPPAKQLSFLKVKTTMFNRKIISSMDVHNINEYNNQLCAPMTKHSNISIDEIENEFNKFEGEKHDVQTTILENIIDKLPTHKAYGIHDIPNEAIKYGGNTLKLILKYVLQIMLNTGYCPEQFGYSTMCPVPKTPTPSGINQYRGISLLFTIRKLFETYLFNTMKIKFPRNQFGFQSKSSIHDAISHLQNILTTRNRNHNNFKFICLLDVKKAYDSLNRHSLFKLFNHYNKYLVRLSLNLIRITNQTLLLLQHLSESINTTSGIPQGSPFSPSLFGFCLMDLYGLENDMFKLIFYADDICVIARDRKSLEKAINQIKAKLNDIGLELNYHKSIIITNNYYKNTSICDIPTTNQSQRYLGYIINIQGIDTYTMFNKKINAINHKMSQLKYLGLFKNGLPLDICATLLTSHITPICDFGMQCIKYKNSQITKLQKLLRKKIKFVIGCIPSIPNSLFERVVHIPNMQKRNDYMFKKHQVHFKWRWGIHYENIYFKRESGAFKFHPQLNQSNTTMISKLLTWNLRPNTRNPNCRMCSNQHFYLKEKLYCFTSNYGFLNHFPTVTSNTSENKTNVLINDNEYPNNVTLFDGYTFVCDASINSNNVGVGIVVIPPNSATIFKEQRFKMINLNCENTPSSTELECISINLCMEYAKNNSIINYRILNDNKGSVNITNYLLDNQDPSKHPLGYHLKNCKYLLNNPPQVEWIKGHNGHIHNERADWLAKNTQNAPILTFHSVSSQKPKMKNHLHLFHHSLNLDDFTDRNIRILNERIRRFISIYNLH
eukprot:NODE_409_length_7945_cov_0.205710.p1 type:complete len:1585 gc:universal NODE_409_length_7945_cov_0.205710:6017-1263(-)